LPRFYKVVHRDDVASILRKGLAPNSYAWRTLKGARTFFLDESEDELLEGKQPMFRILSIDYKGRTIPDPDPDYPGSKSLEARILLKGVEPERVRFIGI